MIHVLPATADKLRGLSADSTLGKVIDDLLASKPAVVAPEKPAAKPAQRPVTARPATSAEDAELLARLNAPQFRKGTRL